MKLSIIVPIYKVEAYLHECIDSILQQTFRDFELILVDDQSPDSCGAICDAYAQKDERIHVIHRKQNGGLSAARNTGIEIAKGEYLTFIDSDDYIGQEYLAKAMDSAYNNNTRTDIVEMPIHVYYNSPSHYVYGNAKDADLTHTFPQSWISWIEMDGMAHTYACNKFFRKHLFEKIRFPEGHTFEDIHTVPKLMRTAQSITFCRLSSSEAQYFYRYRQSSITTTATHHAFNDALAHHCPVISELASTTYPIHPRYKARYFWQITNILIDLLRSLDENELRNDTQQHLITQVYNHLLSLKPDTRYLIQASCGMRAKVKNLPLLLLGLRTHCFCYSGKWICPFQ